jgi:hypothetical protein
MNRNPDRTPVTVEQMVGMARDCGLTDHELEVARGIHEKAAMWFSFLDGVTRQHRFEMCMRGELVLDSSEPFVPKAIPTITIDPFFLAQKVSA